MGNFLRGIVFSAGVASGVYAAAEAIAYEKRAVTECADQLDDVPTTTETLPIECLPYGFDTTDVVEKGVLLHRVHHMPTKDSFISKQNEELNPGVKYVVLILGGITIAGVICLILPDD